MPQLPARFARVILAFAPLFVHRSWRHAQVLLIGALLAPGRRTVTSVLRITGRSRERRFVDSHRVLSRAAWCPRAGARTLLGLLADAFAPSGPVVMAVDDTIERRWGRRIRARGIYRDPVRSSDAHFVKTSGLRWMSLMLLAPIPWAGRVWALPFLTALVPSERCCRGQGRRHKTLIDVARQMVLQARRWLLDRDLVLVADSGFSALLFLDAMRRGGVTAITRLRLDAALYDPAPPRLPGTIGRPRKKGARRPTLRDVLAAQSTSWKSVRVGGLVRRARSRDRDRLGDRRVATRRAARCADPLGAGPRPRGPLRASGAAVHRPRPGSGSDCRLVCEAMAGRGHLSGGARASGRRDAAAVVRQGHRAHHAMPARPVLHRGAPGGSASRSRAATGRGDDVVRQASADLQRRPGRRAPRDLARAAFGHVGAPRAPNKTQPRPAGALGLRPLPRRLNGQSRA